MLRCAQLGLSDEALSGMTMGMVYDLLTEKSNDKADWHDRAVQEDFDNF